MSWSQAKPKKAKGLGLGFFFTLYLIFVFAMLAEGIYGLLVVQHNQATVRPIPGGTLTTGRVVSVQRSCVKECTYQPVIEYTDAAGQPHKFTGPPLDERPAIGSAVRVSYDPRLPGDAHDVSSVSPSHWNGQLVLRIFMTVLGGLGVVGMVWLGWHIWRRQLRNAVLLWLRRHVLPWRRPRESAGVRGLMPNRAAGPRRHGCPPASHSKLAWSVCLPHSSVNPGVQSPLTGIICLAGVGGRAALRILRRLLVPGWRASMRLRGVPGVVRLIVPRWAAGSGRMGAGCP